MKIRIIAVGKIKDQHLLRKSQDFSARISHTASVELVQVRDTDREREGGRILELLKKENGVVFALCEEGRQYTSVGFSRHLFSSGTDLVFVLGGPDGLSAQVKERADKLLSLSKMTFTHEMAQLFLLEQIYRAICIRQNTGYHK